jgi:hypothetical protein
MSEIVTMTIKIIKNPKPIQWAKASLSGDILIPSFCKVITANLPPSRAGKGRLLITARLKDIDAVKASMNFHPNLVITVKILAIPTGPATF